LPNATVAEPTARAVQVAELVLSLNCRYRHERVEAFVAGQVSTPLALHFDSRLDL